VKLKRTPDDFQVEELTDFAPHGGSFALYRLSKRSLGTPEVIAAVQRRWNIARGQISYGGLKDRHALATQYVTIQRGPRRTLKQAHFELAYLGQAARPFSPRDIAGNRFQIVVRDLSDSAVTRARHALHAVSCDGLPNYFDDQRFGSLGESGEFVARAWCAGDWERAVWLALAEPNPHDRPADRTEKQALRGHWGDWAACKAALPRSHRRSIVSFLADRPGDFRGAMARIQVDLRGLYIAAYQSFLWNRLLCGWLSDICRPEQLVPLEIGTGPILFYRGLDADQRRQLATALPLPSARTRLEPGPVRALVDRVLREQGTELRQIRIKYPRDTFFAKGDRVATIMPDRLSHTTTADDLYSGRQKLTLNFDLPRGCYATILIKRLTLPEP
jgi:tRNA pseudouridine13 synthase